MALTLDRLKQLRRQAGQAVAAPGGGGAAVPVVAGDGSATSASDTASTRRERRPATLPPLRVAPTEPAAAATPEASVRGLADITREGGATAGNTTPAARRERQSSASPRSRIAASDVAGMDDDSRAAAAPHHAAAALAPSRRPQPDAGQTPKRPVTAASSVFDWIDRPLAPLATPAPSPADLSAGPAANHGSARRVDRQALARLRQQAGGAVDAPASGQGSDTPAQADPHRTRLAALARHAGTAAGDRAAIARRTPPAPVAGPAAQAPRPSTQPASAIVEPDPRGQNLAALRRLIEQRERRPAEGRAVRSVTAPTPAHAQDRTLPGEEIAPGLRLLEAFLPQPVPTAALSLAFAKRADEAVDPRALLFFDTETTGLAGGTGTRAFMIGAADWHVDDAGCEGLRVRQLVMTTMAAERTMLETFASWLAPGTVLSSYNGRCYDAPLLKTRYRLARLPEPLGALDHVDLLFPTRRRYRGTWENCRLATIERQLLRIVREDDLPGSEAPAAWLNYLRGGSARNLRRVGEHNHQDVVTLALLFQRLVQAEQDERDVIGLDGAL